MSIGETILTQGEFTDEPLAWDAFDAIVEKSGAFRIYREVEGEYLQPRMETELKGARIDRILFPLKKIIDAGWRSGGAIGVEGKRSGVKIGPLISQAIDYSRCGFRIERTPGEVLATVVLKWVFIYPVSGTFGDLASVMANNRIGTCSIYQNRLSFSCCGTGAITLDDAGVKAKDLRMGNRRGSR